jgi:LmbE family N-acetylglucosaminyl deacetylase
MELEKIKYICNCGFSCKKSYYFTNHKPVCKFDNNNNNFNKIVSQLGESEMDIIRKWWNKYSDRIFMQELYPKIGEYLKHHLLPKILDIGFEDFNIINKDLLNNPNIIYFQLEPFINNKIYKNDGLLECKVNELLTLNPEYKKYYHIILDFGVLGAPSVSKKWDEKEIIEYIRNIHGALQDNGIYFLKIDLPYLEMPKYKLDFDKMIYSYFDPISFESYPNGIHIFRENIRRPDFSKRDQYKFYFLKKKKEINRLVFVAHPDDESIWCSEKLDNKTHVIVVFGLSILGIEISKIRKNEFKNAMEIAGCSYEFWNYSEKCNNIDNNKKSEIEEKIVKVLDNFKNIQSIYTHNEFGEYGHIDHINTHKIMKKVFRKYYLNIPAPKIYKFYPSLNYKSEDRFENIPFAEESDKRKRLLDCYKSQTMQKFRNIQLDFIPFIFFVEYYNMNTGDFIFLNHKILSKQEKINLITQDNIHKIPFLRNAYKLAKNNNKRLVNLCTGDVPPVILPNDNRIIVLNTSILWTPQKPINQHIIPPPDISDKFSYFLENPELSIGFVGQKNNGREKILSFFKDSGLKTNFILRDEYILKLKKHHKKEFEDNMNENLFTLCYRGRGNFSVRFYETLMRGRIPIQINSSSIFPYENEIDYSEVGIFIEEDDLDTTNIEKLVKDYYNSKTPDELLQIQKKNRRIYEEYFHPDVYFSQIFQEVSRIMQNEIIFPIGASTGNTITIQLTNQKDYSKKWYIYPFGDTRTRFQKDNPFTIEFSSENNTITIAKIKNNSKYLWKNGWNIPLQLWYPHDVSDFIIPPNYGRLMRNGIKKTYYKYGLVIPFFSRANYVKEFLESLQQSDIENCLIIFMDESMTKDVNDDHIAVHALIKKFTILNLIKVFKNKHGNMHDSILTGWDMIYPFCDFLITLDSDTIMRKDWISKIDDAYHAMKNDYKGNQFILSSGFNTETEHHCIIEKREKYNLKNSIGGCNMFFHKNIYPDYIRKTLISYKWDTNLISYIQELGGVIGTTNPSVIQHIGEVSSGHRNDPSNSNYNKSIDF